MEIKYNFSFSDFVFVLFLIVFAFFFANKIKSTPKFGEKFVLITYGSSRLKLPLNKDRTIKKNNVEIRIENSSVFVKSSSCPDKICMRLGKIRDVGQTIVCVPNRVIIKIVSEEHLQKNKDDALSY